MKKGIDIMEKLNILQVNTGKIWGGAEVHMEDLSRKLQEKGHKIIIACSQDRIVWEKLRQKGFNLRHLPPRLGRTAALIRLIKEENIDIIHSHSGRDFFPCTLAARLINKSKVVLTRHSISPMRKNINNFWAKKLAHQFIAVSQAVANKLIQEDKVFRQKVTVIHNGIDLSNHCLLARTNNIRLEYGISENTGLVGCVGRLHEKKGQLDLLKVIPLILQEHPKTKFLLVGEDMTGGGEQAKLNNLISELGLEDTVVFTGFRSDVPQVMAGLDIFVLPSHEGHEGFPLVILEALAQQIPVIATSVSGVPEMIREDENGILVCPEKPAELAKAINLLLQEPKKAKAMGEKGRYLVEKEFNLEVMVSKVENLYYQLIEERG